jgi:hypothetical protein
MKKVKSSDEHVRFVALPQHVSCDRREKRAGFREGPKLTQEELRRLMP